jgi:hypothetical protein
MVDSLDFLDFLGGLLGGALAGLAVVRYLAARFVEQVLVKDLEKYKTQLAQRTEALKVELGIYSSEQSVTRARLDNQRSAAVVSVYAALVAWIRPTRELLRGPRVVEAFTPEYDEETEASDKLVHALKCARQARSAGQILEERVQESAIFFDEKTYERLLAAEESSRRIINDFLESYEAAEAQHIDFSDYEPHGHADLRKLESLFAKQIEPLHADVLRAFRRLLGADLVQVEKPSDTRL